MKKFNFKWLLLSFILSIASINTAWAGTYTVVGVAMENSSNYYPRISINVGGSGDGCASPGWWNWLLDENKAGITFEGRKLYLAQWTDCWNGTDDFYFQQISKKDNTGANEVNNNHVHASYTSASSYHKKIWQYNESNSSGGSWYSSLTMTTSKVYFDATGWSETDIDLCIAHMNYQAFYDMAHVAHTKLYYTNASYSWDDAMGFGVVGGYSRADEQSATGAYWITDISDNAAEYTGFKHTALNNNDANHAYLCVNAGKTGQQPTVSSNSSYATLLNSTQTIKSYVSEDYGSSYDNADSKATITITSFAMTSQGASGATASNGSLSTSAKSTTVTSARTATTTLSVGTVADGYVFVGWYDGSGNALPDDGDGDLYTYTYYPTGATEVRAYFKNERTHTVTISNYCTTTSSEISSSSRSIGESTPVSITAPDLESQGYRFVNWTLGNGMTNRSANLTANPIRVTTDGAGSTYTMTANYTKKTLVTLYYSNPSSWSTVYAYVWKNGDGSDHNASWTDNSSQGANITSQTITRNCKTYYYYSYYYEDHTGWNRVIFSNNTTSAKSSDITYSYSTNNNQYNNATHGTTGSWTALPAAVSYDITVESNDEDKGSVDPTSGTANNVGCSLNISASAKTDFVFDHWSATTGVTVNETDNKNTYVTASQGGTVTAYFEDQWCIKGDQWDSWSTSKGLPKTGTNTYSKSYTLNKGTKYTFKVHDRKTNTWYGNTNGGGEHAMERGASAFSTTAEGSNNNLTITPDVTGSYTFTINTSGSTPSLTVAYPTAYTVTYGAGTINGSDADISVSPSFTSGDYVLPETDITFSKGTTKDGYTWKGWYSDEAGSATLHEDDDADFTWSATRTGNISVYACYNFITYSITYNLNGGSNPVSPAPATSFNVETSTITLPTPTRTGYTFDGWYANSDLSTGGVKTQIAKGTHANQEFWAKWTANDYTITLKPNGGSGDDQSVTATFDAPAPDYDADAKNYKFADITNPTKTGYTFEGWWTSSDEGTTLVTEIITKYKFYEWNTTYVNNSGLWKNAGNVTAYAKWTANTTTITLDQTGYGTEGSVTEKTATYDAAMPAITGTNPLPVAPAGYKFMGYYDALEPLGTKYYNADGTSAHTWDKDVTSATLHAYFQKAEISLALSASSVVPGGTVTATPTLTPYPEPTVSVCWHLLYNNGSEHAAEFTPGVGNAVSFTAPEEGGVYIVTCAIHVGSSCGSGEVIDSTTQSFRVAGSNTVTIRYRDNSGNTIAPDGSVVVPALESVGVKAPNIIGYSFSSWTLGDVLHNECASDASCGTGKDSINISADYDGVLTATYTKKNMIYFNNTLGWEDVYVYFYNNDKYWNDTYGTGAYKGKYFDGTRPYYEVEHGHMTQIAGTNVWYFDYTAASYSTRSVVAFANMDKSYSDGDNTDDNSKAFFSNTTLVPIQVIRRSDHSATLPMFVPLTGQADDLKNDNKANYVSKGYWMNYPDNTGYTLKIYDNTTDGALKKELKFPFAADKKMPMSITTDLEGSKTYGFKIVRADGEEYGNTGTMTNGHSGDKSVPDWEFKSDVSNRAGLTTSSAGDYVITLTYGIDLNSKYNYLVGVHYPEATGDYRVLYKDNKHTNWLASAVIPKSLESETISYYVRKDQEPIMKLQTCTATWDGETTTVTWTDTVANLISSLPSAITTNGDGVYYFCLNKKGDGTRELGDTKLYEGNFYIRVDGAGSSDWDNFRATDHMMTYSDYAEDNEGFTHYYTHWYDCSGGVKNIKFVVANDYSVNISDTLTREEASDQWEHIADYIDGFGNLSRSANVRFMYNKSTNDVSRAFIDGAYADGGNFLKILAQSTDSIYEAAAGGDPLTEITFKDNGNWIYEKTVYAVPGARYKLRSLFGTTEDSKHVITQFFKGGSGTTASDSATIIGGTGSTRYKIRLLYDFKTNRVVTAYMPQGTISGDMHINADIMFLREHQEDIEEIDFTGTAKIDQIKTVYCGIQFNKWTLNNRSKTGEHPALSPLLSRYERDLFYISFPYDVKLSDVIGFGTYGQHWIIEYYDGAERAAKGFWKDTETFWKFVTPAMKNSFELKAGTGYIVALDLDELWYKDALDHSSVWDNTDVVELLFPGNVTSISNTSVTYTVPEHTCTIGPRFEGGEDRRIKDSHWNVLGVPTYHNLEDGEGVTPDNTTWTTAHPNYIYTWNPQDNSLTPTAGATFDYQAMHAYVVQYSGDVTFNTSSSPAPTIVARRTYVNAPSEVEFRLELSQNDATIDRTFVKLSNEENVSAGFAFGEDLSKEFNANKANIYTFITDVQAAGNTLPMSEQTTVIPVGVKIKADGDYTFAIPEGTEGIGVTLIDNETGVRTSLSALDYTINLSAGTYNERFVLEISPIKNTPTGVEAVTGDGLQVTGARKIMIDGILYIVKDGKMFDARGNRIQ